MLTVSNESYFQPPTYYPQVLDVMLLKVKFKPEIPLVWPFTLFVSSVSVTNKMVNIALNFLH